LDLIKKKKKPLENRYRLLAVSVYRALYRRFLAVLESLAHPSVFSPPLSSTAIYSFFVSLHQAFNGNRLFFSVTPGTGSPHDGPRCPMAQLGAV
jgi:hypothetical protein